MAILKDTVVNGTLHVNYNGTTTDIFDICRPSVWKITHKYGGDSYPNSDSMTGYYYTLLDGSVLGFFRKKYMSATGAITFTDKYTYPVTVKDVKNVYAYVALTTGFSPDTGEEVSNRFFTSLHMICESFTTTDFVVRGYKNDAANDMRLGYNVILFIPSTNIVK